MKYFAQLHYQCYFVGMNKLQIGKGREFEICGEMTDRTPTDTFNIFKIFIRMFCHFILFLVIRINSIFSLFVRASGWITLDLLDNEAGVLPMHYHQWPSWLTNFFRFVFLFVRAGGWM